MSDDSSEPRGADSEDEWMPDERYPDSIEDKGGEEDEEEGQAEEEDDEDAENLEDALFENQLDPISLLENMGRQATWSDEAIGYQPYQILTNTAKQARAHHAAAPSTRSKEQIDDDASDQAKEAPQKKKGRGRPKRFGATVDDIWDGQDEDAVEGFEKAQKSLQRRRKRRKKNESKGKRQRELPEEVLRKQGEANLLYATGKFEQAIPLLQEVIKIAPSLTDPYKTMGLCYEQTGNNRKALDFYMITAHMAPKDVALWKRLAALSSELGFVRQAIYCLTKVIRRDKTNADVVFDRALLYIEVGEARRACKEFEKVQSLRPDDAEVPMMLARVYHGLKQADKAIEILEAFLKGHPLSAEATHMNILAELYMEGKHHQKAVQLIQRASEHICPTGLPIDLQVKLGICLAHIGLLAEALKQLEILFQDPVEQDLCLDAADTLLQHQHFAEAIKLYERVGREVLHAAGLWEKLADCYVQMDNLPGAVNVYVRVANGTNIQLDKRKEAAIALAELLSEKKMHQQTMSALKHLDKLGINSLELLSRKGQVLLDLGDLEGYADAFVPVIKNTIAAASSKKAKNSQNQKANLAREVERRKKIIDKMKKMAEQEAIFKGFVTQDRRTKKRVQADEKLAQLLAEDRVEDPGTADKSSDLLLSDVSRNDGDAQIVAQTARVLIEINDATLALDLVNDCITYLMRRCVEREMRDRRDGLRLVAAEAAIAAGEPSVAVHHMRQACESFSLSNAVWNRVCQASIPAPNLLRQMQKTLALKSLDAKDNLAMRLMKGHCQALEGAHGSALDEYMAAYQIDPEEPLSLLCLGTTHLSHAVNRKVPDRDAAVLAAFAFLQAYCKKRKNKQEAYYNLGRAAHQLGLLHLAVPWYYQALAIQSLAPYQKAHSLSEQSPGDVDLTKEIAYNLALLFRRSGGHGLAKDIMAKYMTI